MTSPDQQLITFRHTFTAYMLTSRPIAVDLTKISGKEPLAWWFNPRNDKATLAGRFPTTGTKEFTPPASGDCVLVLDDALKQLSAPGTGR